MKNDTVNSRNVVWQTALVTRAQREARNRHRGVVVWLTGLPAAGKSTVARATEDLLHRQGFHTMLLDGDNLRSGLCSDLGFSIPDRNENVRRTGEVAKLFLEAGAIVLVALVSPLRAARDAVRKALPEGDFLEIYCQCAVAVCRERDPKGHYAQAEDGRIANFTGVSADYEMPLAPALALDTASESPEESARKLMQLLLGHLQRP